MISVKRGLKLPISGAPQGSIENFTKKVNKFAVLGKDFVGMKPTMKVKVGDHVKIGQTLFTDKKTEGVHYTSPANGTVLEINRGDKRVLESVVISNEGDAQLNFNTYKSKSVNEYNRQEIQDLLIESGEWVALRRRPFNKVANPSEVPRSIFITAMDTNPLAPVASEVLKHGSNEELFHVGCRVISKLTEGKTYVCIDKHTNVEVPKTDNLVYEVFDGPHPAGNVGTHIHFLDPVSAHKFVWHINYQDVIAIGHLFKTGSLKTDRIITLAGPRVRNPKTIKVRRGIEISQYFADEVYDFNDARFISGSVFNGRQANGSYNFLGRYHQQVTVLKEGREREFLGWQAPGLNKFSVTSAFLSAFIKKKSYDFDTSTHGSHRAILPLGSYEKVMPLDILATYLLRSIMAEDTEKSQKLGVLELAEEDVALLSYVDAGKADFGSALRNVLEKIEKDG